LLPTKEKFALDELASMLDVPGFVFTVEAHGLPGD